ncbi:hypothetical protein SELMODRAFT_443873 [Selaginella moellendorffii]|uniref:E3 SUMO-protein ligase SIZ1 n=1 Tax=Selaginella moellendorffii TaxID=88036 RepID=D8S552_SELML|nr:E3 SUMO-protein ligase SIZ1 [Selaginella moellendorffii]EFJ20543.1 hypothetical protein SELMODRAFT_443873 [Selaginella moellendorffii]|eukprot:XP_024539236.1 E3 SUMO-protein ligase SIZ1 [Selaginella moellendorffii]
MGDLARCKTQLASFRIKELKDVLTRLGLPKQGKKQVLMDKVLAVLVPSEWQQHPVQKGFKPDGNRSSIAAQVIDDIYRKLRGSGAVELASGHRNFSGAVSVSAGRSDEPDETENRCPCGSPLDTGTMIQCDNQACKVWQHLNCVVIPENAAEGVEPDVPSQFYCEICRINYGDPFCVTLSQPLPAAKFYAPAALQMEGASPLHSLEKTFILSKADRENLHKPNHDLQVWCLLLNDKVPFRMHWPDCAELRVNGVVVRVTTRAAKQLLGANGRDDGPGITACTREGTNRISLSACDARPFCMGVRIIRRLSVEQVMSLIPSAARGESFEEALARVRRCIDGGASDAGDDDDSDLEVVADSVTMNLSCPMSGSRIHIAGRFKPCAHMGGFDLKTFVELNQRARKWQCPVCMKNYSLDQLIIDPFFNRITHAMKDYGEDIKEVELKADGSWRPKLEGETVSRQPWRSPDGTPVLANGFHKATVKQEEGVSQGRPPLKIGMKRTHDGSWAVLRPSGGAISKPKEPSYSRSTSATDTNNEDDERSVNQEPYSKDYTGDNEAGLRAGGGLAINAWKKSKATLVDEAPASAGDVIVLSDSDEESGSPGGPYNNGKQQHNGGAAPSSSYGGSGKNKDRLANGATGGARGRHSSSRHTGSDGGGGGGGMGMPLESSLWSQPSQEVPYSFFDAAGPARQAKNSELDFAYQAYEMDEDGGGDDTGPSKSGFRLFLPPQPAREQRQTLQNPAISPGEQLDEDWFSLSLGGGDNVLNAANDNTGLGLPLSSSREYTRPARERLDSLANTATVLLGLNNNNGAGHSRRNQHLSRQRSYFRAESQSE